jgi:energy-coupling factor transport system substrate-specific component
MLKCSAYTLPLLLIAGFVCGVIGGMIGQKIFKKHFKRAGIA